MTWSKLEKNLLILEILVTRPLEFENLLYQSDQNWGILRNHLEFLISHNLVESLPLGKGRTVYSITDKGVAVLNGLQGQTRLREQKDITCVFEE